MPAPRLPVHQPEAKRDNDRKARRREHAAAFAVAIWRITRHLVGEIGKPGMRLLEEIADGTKRGPAEVLEQIVSVARDHKDEADAMAPVRVLAHRLGYDLAPLLLVAGDLGVDGAAAEAGREFAEAVSAALDCGRKRFAAISAGEVESEIAEAIHALHRLRRELQKDEPPQPRRIEVSR